MSDVVMFEGRPWMESVPDPVQRPGMLDFNGNGIAGCVRCGYRGSATSTGGVRVGRPLFYMEGMPPGSRVEGSTRSEECPACEIGAETAEMWARRRRLFDRQPVVKLRRVGRNDPCHCGSGRKYKKCHGALA